MVWQSGDNKKFSFNLPSALNVKAFEHFGSFGKSWMRRAARDRIFWASSSPIRRKAGEAWHFWGPLQTKLFVCRMLCKWAKTYLGVICIAFGTRKFGGNSWKRPKKSPNSSNPFHAYGVMDRAFIFRLSLHLIANIITSPIINCQFSVRHIVKKKIAYL